MKITRHETRPCGDGNGGTVCRICRERFPLRGTSVMVVSQDQVVELDFEHISNSTFRAVVEDIVNPHAEIEPCQPPVQPMTIHRVGVYAESGHGHVRDPQRCLDCEVVVAAPGREKPMPPGDVFETSAYGCVAFLSRESAELRAGEVANAKRCAPKEAAGIITHRVVDVPVHESQCCIDCGKVLSGTGAHFPPGQVGQSLGNGLKAVRPCVDRSGGSGDQGPKWR